MNLSRALLYISLCSSSIAVTNAFVPNSASSIGGITSRHESSASSTSSLSVGFLQDFFQGGSPSPLTGRNCQAKDLMQNLIQDKKCFATEVGALAFGEACANDVVYNDCYEPSPFVGKEAVIGQMVAKVNQRKQQGDVRIDKISDGNVACGYAWTWVDGDQEGLRGTTFVELNSEGKIQFVQEIPEPIYKPGDLTLELLKAVTKGAEEKPKPEYTQRTPTAANEVAKYLFLEVQGGEVEESLRLFSDSIIYRDFNYEEVLKGTAEVKQFIEDFSFPGIEFKAQKFCDGVDSTCFTWEVRLNGQTDAIKGISFYELDPETRKVCYIRDVPESAIKPPPLGRLARILKPGLGVLEGVAAGSRPGGM
eukprot:CAMPEP_0113636434 /NCGR_PEP_ID=MMETSP0017_2-20120614/19022_1 /TAXON_ID=2856 /ORGANISM="Cylindrotheca closterium" /LENGTH=363 /DNA_ID=CAMNT_0000547317 /DNA_START=22 /DNA_END=1113 /DNA_ORIENTATION=- /assembly_acc=CAM_ASM_000147